MSLTPSQVQPPRATIYSPIKPYSQETVDAVLLMGRKIQEYKIDHGSFSSQGSGDCLFCCFCASGSKGGDGLLLLILAVATVGLAISSFVSWGITLFNVNEAIERNKELKNLKDEISKLPLCIKDSINSFENTCEKKSTQWALCKIVHDTLKIAKNNRDELIVRCTFQASMSMGLTLLTTAGIIAVLAVFNITCSPLVLFCVSSIGGGLFLIGLAGYTFTVITHSDDDKKSAKLEELIQKRLDPKKYLESNPENTGYIKQTSVTGEIVVLYIENPNVRRDPSHKSAIIECNPNDLNFNENDLLITGTIYRQEILYPIVD